MKSKKFNKALSLNKRTVANLEKPEMMDVNGGIWHSYFHQNECQTQIVLSCTCTDGQLTCLCTRPDLTCIEFPGI